MSTCIKMTGKQRFQCSINHQEPDYVPIVENLYSRRFFKEILGYAPETADPVSLAKLAQKVGYDISFCSMGVLPGITLNNVGTIYTNEWGITFKKDESNWPIDGPIAYPLKDATDWKNYSMPDPTLESRYTGVKEAIRITNEYKMGIIGKLRGPFSASWFLYGLDKFSLMLYEEPEVVHSIMKAMTEFAICGAVKMVELGVDSVFFQDDYGSNISPLMSVNHFNEFVAPYIKKLVNAVHKVNGKIIMHSDGQIMPLLPACVEAGVDGLNPIQRGAGMDLATVKQRYGDQLCLIGNVDQRDLMPNGTPEQVAEQVKECIEIAAPGGGYVLSSDHSMHDDIPPENILAMYEAGRRYGKYPIK